MVFIKKGDKYNLKTNKSENKDILRIEFFKGCWVYPRYSERLKIKKVIEILKEEPKTQSQILRRVGYAKYDSILKTLYLLLALRIVHVKHKNITPFPIKLWGLEYGWRKQMDKKFHIIKRK